MSDTKPIAPLATGPVWSIAGVVALAQLIAAVIGGGYWFDEVYMVAIGSKHLDWGSADQPPLTPALAAAIDWIIPESVVALRIPAIIATACAVVVAALIAREMGGDRRAQTLVAAAQATALWIAMGGHWLTPYALEPVQWLLIFWLLTRWLRLRDDRLLLALGVVIGVAAMTKFQVLLLCAVLLCAVAACGPRELLRRRAFWLGALIAAVIAAPTLAWQAANDWPQLRMGPIVAEEAGPLYGGRPGIAVTLILFAGLAAIALMGYGAWLLVRSPEWRRYRFLAVTVLALYVMFVVTAGRPYYLSGAYGVLAAAGAVGLQRRREMGRTRWRRLVWPGYAVSVALAVAFVVLGATNTRSDVPERIAEHTAQAYHALPDGQRERTAVVGESYIVAAYVDGYADRYDMPRAYSTTRSYGYFDPPAEQQDSILFVGSDPERWRPYFAGARKVANVRDQIDAWLLTGRNQPWAVLWPQLRTLRVG